MPHPRFHTPALLASLALAAGLLGTSQALPDTNRVAAYLGAASFAFHHWVWSPYKNGLFAPSAAERTPRVVKGGAALLFAAHEVRAAQNVIRTSEDPLLQKLDARLDHLQAAFDIVGNALQRGQFSEAALLSLSSEVAALGSAAAAGGQPIRDIAAPIPGL